MFLSQIWKEVRRHLTNAPWFPLNMDPIESTSRSHVEEIHQQLQQLINSGSKRLIFLLGPFGAGKTTQIHYFMKKNPLLHYSYKSFVKINTLDLAFLHMTKYSTRFIFLIGSFLLAYLLIRAFPSTGALPFLIIIAYFFVKNTGSLIYMLHEAMDNLITGKHRIVIMEDLERSSLSFPDQWALLANLWQLKRTYIIPLGYSPEDRLGKMRMIEYAQKLGGFIIEVSRAKTLNYSLIKHLDNEFPFEISTDETSKRGDWISLFTPREMMTILEQVKIRSIPSHTNKDRKTHYIHVCLELLLAKLGVHKRQMVYDDQANELKSFFKKELSPEQSYFIASFQDSIKSSLGNEASS